MNTLVISNKQKHLKCIVFTPRYTPRPVANIDTNGITQQCVVNGDIVIYKSEGIDLRMYVAGKEDTTSDNNIINKCVDKHMLEFLDNDQKQLPENITWNGQDTINKLVFEYGLDKFLVGIPDYAVLGGLMGLNTDFTIPSVGTFNVPKLFKNVKVNIYNISTYKNCVKLLSTVDQNYREWLLAGGLAIPLESSNWTRASRLPQTLSVSCIIDNGKPVRFNDLIVWRDKDEEPEVISVFDIVDTLAMTNTNFISIPYIVGEDVTRAMYVVHGENLTNSNNNVAWLYRKR